MNLIIPDDEIRHYTCEAKRKVTNHGHYIIRICGMRAVTFCPGCGMFLCKGHCGRSNRKTLTNHITYCEIWIRRKRNVQVRY